jgi:WD40 repeat protein
VHSVVSASNDRSIKVWDINDGTCVHTITTDEFGGPPMSVCATQTNSTVSFYTAGLLDHVGGWRVLDATGKIQDHVECVFVSKSKAVSEDPS